MQRGRFTEDQIIAVLREHEAGVKTADLCRKHGISDATFHTWKSKYGGLTVSDAARLRAREEENRRLKKLLAESMLNVSALKDLLGKN
ncbi:transposase [Sphingomonas glacialis]|uniref:Transposase n=1 Tax=Sphingomonas glacialis TaxID=658225 RepID=A0ABQ3LJC2_9SPHN|nr:transposase [Sphingomonas glacialis]